MYIELECVDSDKRRLPKRSKALARKAKKFNDYEKSNPAQLSLFQLQFGEDLSKSDKIRFSQAIHLVDSIPMWSFERKTLEETKQSDRLLREFSFDGLPYTAVIYAAGVTDVETKETRFFLPGRKELLIESVLRKMLVDQKDSIFLDGQVALRFTLNSIRTELSKFGHTANIKEIKKSLEILSKANIDVFQGKGKGKKSNQLFFSIIDTLSFSKAEDEDENETKSFVILSPLVTSSIMSINFRLIDYERLMSYRSSISCLIHKRLVLNFTYAQLGKTYTIYLSNLVRDLGLKEQRLKDNKREVEKALEELSTGKYDGKDNPNVKKPFVTSKYTPILLNYKIEAVYDEIKKNKIVDHLITFSPSMDFASDVIKANSYLKNNKSLSELSSLQKLPS